MSPPKITTESIWAVETAFASKLFDAIKAGPGGYECESSVNVVNMGGVALLEVRGVLTKYPSYLQAMFGGAASTDIQAAFNKAINDQSIHAICVVVDSPGGAVSGVPELADAIFAAKQSGKQVVMQVDGVMASAAYYFGSQADKIYATHRTNRIGAIGAMMALADTSKQAEEEGIEIVVATTGELKPMGMPGVALSEAMRASMLESVTAANAEFTAAIQRGRGLKPEQLSSMSDGRVINAAEAVTAGLIDGIQSLDVTLAALQGSNRTVPKTKGKTMAGATFAEIKAECVGAPAEFIVQCQESGAELPQVKANWEARRMAIQAEQATKIETLTATVATLTAELATEKARTAPIIKGKEVPAGGSSQNSGELTATQQFQEGVNALAATGLSRAVATAKYVSQNPTVHAAFLAEMKGAK